MLNIPNIALSYKASHRMMMYEIDFESNANPSNLKKEEESIEKDDEKIIVEYDNAIKGLGKRQSLAMMELADIRVFLESKQRKFCMRKKMKENLKR